MKKELIKSSSNSATSSNEGEVQNKSVTSSVSSSPSPSSCSSLSQTLVLTLTPYETECLETVKKISKIFVERPEQPRKVIGFAADLRSLFSVQTVFFEAVAAVAGATLPGFDFLPWEERLSVLAEAVPKIMFFRTAYYFHFELNSFIVRVVNEKKKGNFERVKSLIFFVPSGSVEEQPVSSSLAGDVLRAQVGLLQLLSSGVRPPSGGAGGTR